jgi:hypothetical protein
LHFFDAHIDMLDYTPVKHASGNIPATALLLEVIETLQGDAFTMGEPISDIW